MPAKGSGRHQLLLNDEKVRTWHEALALGSPLSAEGALRRMGLLAEEIGLTPAELAKLAKADPDSFAAKLVAFATKMKKKGRLDSYVAQCFLATKSWLKHCGVPFTRFPRLRILQGVSIRNERVPTPEELGRILAALPIRLRAAALLMAHSGCRPSVLTGRESGDRPGLTLRDLVDLDIEKLEFRRTPFLIRVPSTLQKTSVEGVTFGTAEEARALIVYFRERRESGERLTPDSPVIAVEPEYADTNRFRREGPKDSRFIVTRSLTQRIRTGIDKVVPEGVTWRPYVLRAYASARLLSAEHAGKITRDVREAILQHNLGVSGRYNLSKRLHEDQVEEMRQEYAAASPFLETTGHAQDEAAEFKRKLLEAVGLTPEEAAKYDAAPREELLKVMRERLLGQSAGSGPGTAQSSATVQRPVRLKEVDELLAKGWRYVAPLGRDRVVLEPPSVGR
jgi:integrase